MTEQPPRRTERPLSLAPEAAAFIDDLGLEPHPEGGWYRRVVESKSRLVTPAGVRPAVTSILYLLTAGDVSRPHRVRHDEVWHLLAGGALAIAEFGAGQYRETVLAGAGDGTFAHLVPGGAWQAARPLGQWSLAGCTVAPGFDFADFEIACGDSLDALLAAAPAMAGFLR